MPDILVCDDEREIADLLEVYLTADGFNVHKCFSGEEAVGCVEAMPVDLAVLDIMLPDIDGFTLLRKIRERHFFPVIMLTARVEDNDKIKGLTLGADDYITKPFNPLEVAARVKTQLRRYKSYNKAVQPECHEIDIRGLVLNELSHKCFLYGKELVLTPMEFAILRYLCVNRGRVVSAEELFEQVWGEKFFNSSNTVMAHIARLREKLHEPPKNPKFIKTVWGVGYTIE